MHVQKLARITRIGENWYLERTGPWPVNCILLCFIVLGMATGLQTNLITC